MILKPGISIEIRKKIYKNEIPDAVVELTYGERDESGNLTDSGKASIARFHKKYEFEGPREEPKKIEKKVKKDVVVS